MADEPDMPLENFGADTEVAAPPAAEPEPQGEGEQTTQPVEANGSEDATEGQPEQTEDNSKADNEGSIGRPEKRDRVQGRFNELTSRIKERDAQIEQYEAQLARAQAMQGLKPLQADENGEYSAEAIQANQAQLAQAEARAAVQALEQRLEREQQASRMDAEGNEIEKMLKEKGLDNELHFSNIRQDIEDRLALAQYNPQALKQISAKKIAERYVKGIEAERRNASSTTAQNVQTIQAEQAVSPNAPAQVDDNSDEALLARLADIKF